MDKLDTSASLESLTPAQVRALIRTKDHTGSTSGLAKLPTSQPIDFACGLGK